MRRVGGSTLIELIVVGSIFLAVLAALWGIYEATMVVERNVNLKVDLDREVIAAARNLDALLKTSRLEQPADWFNAKPVDSIELLPLSVGDNGLPLLTSQGMPQFGTPFKILCQNGVLQRPDTKRRLARLGDSGKVQFLRSSQGMLDMNLQIEKTGYRGKTTSRQLTFQFCLYNQ